MSEFQTFMPSVQIVVKSNIQIHFLVVFRNIIPNQYVVYKYENSHDYDTIYKDKKILICVFKVYVWLYTYIDDLPLVCYMYMYIHVYSSHPIKANRKLEKCNEKKPTIYAQESRNNEITQSEVKPRSGKCSNIL